MKERSMFLHSKSQNYGENQDIRRISYHKNGMEINYPEVISGGTQEQQNTWNEIIRKDIDQILQIYTFEPFPGRFNSLTENDSISFILDYEIMLNTDKVLSILYKASYYNPYSAYPTVLVYTTNIDKKNNKRLRLPDITYVTEEFVDNFRTWDIARSREKSYKYMDVVRDYRDSISDEELLTAFMEADQIGSKNTWQVYSYLTPQNLGISIYAPNYLGDHVEFERALSKLQGMLKI